MGLLRELIEQPPDGKGEGAWWLWLEAERCRRALRFGPALEALEAADAAADAAGWTPDSKPIWALEAAGLRAKVHEDGGEPALAHGSAAWALDGWLLIGEAFGRPDPQLADRARVAAMSAAAMVTTLVGSERLVTLGREIGGTPWEAALSLWLVDRLVPEVPEIAARAVSLTVDVQSPEAAAALAERAAAQLARWELPDWDPVLVAVRVRQPLVSPRGRTTDAEGALALAERLLEELAGAAAGAARDRTEAELRANRAGACLELARPDEAAADYERAQAGFAALGLGASALRVRVAAQFARADAGLAVGLAELRALINEVAAVAAGDGMLMGDLELLRRWLLCEVARNGDGDLEEVVGLIETMRGDQPLMRRGSDHADPVVARLCRPFTVLGSRLAALSDTVLVTVDPGLHGSRPRPPVFLVIRGGRPLRWRLVTAGAEQVDATVRLLQVAGAEQQRLVTGELAIQTPASDALRGAGAAAWAALPAELRDAILAARTVLYLPSALASLDLVPLELLHHDGGWLGLTHVIARCPSFQYLEAMLAPNARAWPEDRSATIVEATPDAQLGALASADADVETALRAASVLGLEAEHRRPATVAEGLEVFRGALVHYVGHGFASAVGEFLPLAGDAMVSASQLGGHGGGRVPFVFLNACLLGRSRHLRGGRQKGWAVELLERGAPGVVAALYPVPDTACPQVAEAFYRGAWRAPVGEGMRRARVQLDEQGVNPLVWAAYVLHGDPAAVISHAVTDGPRATAELTRRWPALLTRRLATGTGDEVLQRALREDVGLPPDARDALLAWTASGAADLAGLTGALLDVDPEGAAACRVLLGLERAGDLETAYLAASALDDGYAMLALLAAAGWDADVAARRTTAEAWLGDLAADRAALERLATAIT